MKPARPNARDTAEPALPGRWYRPRQGEGGHTKWASLGASHFTSFHWPFSSLTTTRERSSEP